MNEKGGDFSKRLTDALHDHGIRPHATLSQRDSPQALEDRFGILAQPGSAQDFAADSTSVVSRPGDRVSDRMTINEMFCFTYMR